MFTDDQCLVLLGHGCCLHSSPGQRWHVGSQDKLASLSRHPLTFSGAPIWSSHGQQPNQPNQPNHSTSRADMINSLKKGEAQWANVSLGTLKHTASVELPGSQGRTADGWIVVILCGHGDGESMWIMVRSLIRSNKNGWAFKSLLFLLVQNRRNTFKEFAKWRLMSEPGMLSENQPGWVIPMMLGAGLWAYPSTGFTPNPNTR